MKVIQKKLIMLLGIINGLFSFTSATKINSTNTELANLINSQGLDQYADSIH